MVKQNVCTVGFLPMQGNHRLYFWFPAVLNNAFEAPTNFFLYRYNSDSCICFIADSLADVDAHDIRNWGNDFFAAAMKIAMEAITEV